MAWIPAELKEAAEQVNNGEMPVHTVRTLLSWFHAQRRGSSIVHMIRSALSELDLATEPDFRFAWIDSSVGIARKKVDSSKSGPSLASGSPTATTTTTTTTTPDPGVPVQASLGHVIGTATEGAEARLPDDPTPRVSLLASANRSPIRIAPDAALSEATTIMMCNDFSQLPVMTSEREVKGVVSWKSIGSRLAMGQSCKAVRDCMDRHCEVADDALLFRVIPLIVENDFVLVRDQTKKICGIVTTSDLSDQFGHMGEPFLILGEIENHIRTIVADKFTAQELAAMRDPGDSTRTVENAWDLSLGEHQRLLQNPTNWDRLGIVIDRKTFIDSLERVRRIRNDVMHFDPDGIVEEDMDALRRFVAFLQRLREIHPVSSQIIP